MQAIKSVQGRVAPVSKNDIDTDQIIPARFLKSVSREGFGEALFSDIKKEEDSFFLNNPVFNGAKILVAGENFGCGSSREHAVWAIKGAGFQAVIAKSFADIFSSNSGKNGLLLLSLKPQLVDEILDKSKNGDFSLSIDIEKQEVSFPGGKTESFSYDSFRKHCLVNGLDDIDYILSHKDKISDFVSNKKRFYSTTDNE